MTYQFDTTAEMKEYNRRKWWIDPDIIPPFSCEADTLPAALDLYRKHCENEGINVSANAIRNKNEMYIDTDNGTIQTGYVITGHTDMEDNTRCKLVSQYIDLWVSIHIITYPDF